MDFAELLQEIFLGPELLAIYGSGLATILSLLLSRLLLAKTKLSADEREVKELELHSIAHEKLKGLIETLVIATQKEYRNVEGFDREKMVLTDVYTKGAQFLEVLGYDADDINNVIKKVYEGAKAKYPHLFKILPFPMTTSIANSYPTQAAVLPSQIVEKVSTDIPTPAPDMYPVVPLERGHIHQE